MNRLPVPIDIALIGPDAMASAQLRERHVLPVVVDANVLIEDAMRRLAYHEQPTAISHLLAIRAIRLFGKPRSLSTYRRSREDGASTRRGPWRS